MQKTTRVNGAVVAIREPTKEQARALFDEIKATGETWVDVTSNLAELLTQAKDNRSWAVLGYPTWQAAVEAEFHFTRQRAYQLLDLGRVRLALNEATSTTVDISEREARDLKSHLGTFIPLVKQLVADTPAPKVAYVVRAAVSEERKRIKVMNKSRGQDDFAEVVSFINQVGLFRKFIKDWTEPIGLGRFRPQTRTSAIRVIDKTIEDMMTLTGKLAEKE